MESSVFSAVFVDDQSTQIEGTFWRDAAEYYHENLEEGKVHRRHALHQTCRFRCTTSATLAFEMRTKNTHR